MGSSYFRICIVWNYEDNLRRAFAMSGGEISIFLESTINK